MNLEDVGANSALSKCFLYPLVIRWWGKTPADLKLLVVRALRYILSYSARAIIWLILAQSSPRHKIIVSTLQLIVTHDLLKMGPSKQFKYRLLPSGRVSGRDPGPEAAEVGLQLQGLGLRDAAAAARPL